MRHKTAVKVLLVFSSGQIGGAERSLTRMACLGYPGLEYHFGTIGGKGPWFAWAKSLGLHPVLFGGEQQTLASLLYPFSLFHYVKKHQIQSLYLCGFRLVLVARLLFLGSGVSIIHGVRSNPYYGSAADFGLRLVERLTGFLGQGWITNSHAAKHTLIKKCRIPAEKISVIYNGLELPATVVIKPDQKPCYIVTVANLSRRKGHLEFLVAVRQVVDQVPQAKFVFVGRDDLQGRIQEAVRRAGLGTHVEFLGFQADVAQILRTARVFALPSLRAEGCPTAILEAMAYGIPCVAFSVDGVPEMLEEGRNGFLIPPGNYRLFAEKLIRLLKDKTCNLEMGVCGKAMVQSRFQIKTTAEEHGRFFLHLHQGGVESKARV